jgi:NitT/TauT family transport system substrate-binding protein
MPLTGEGTALTPRRPIMQISQNRRRFLATLSATGATALIHGSNSSAQEAAPETTTIRLAKMPGICIAPQYVAEDLLKTEGFTDVQYFESGINLYPGFASNKIDISIAFIAPFIFELDAGAPIVVLGGVHAGCFELFGTERVQAIRDLKGKTVAIPEVGSSPHLFAASMVSYIGLDSRRDVNFALHPVAEAMELLENGKIDALVGFPPVPQELRDRKIGHVIVNSGLDRPWSQYFCCMVGAHREFVSRHPVAAKRALRAILKAAQFCSAEPESAARMVAEKGYRYDYALQTMKDIRYANWRDYDPDDAMRFYALRLREAGMIKSTPNRILVQGTNWSFFNELKRELKG